MTRTVYILIATAYVCIGIGWAVTVAILSDQADDAERQADEVTLITGALCQAIQAPEPEEQAVLDQVAIASGLDLSVACNAIL